MSQFFTAMNEITDISFLSNGQLEVKMNPAALWRTTQNAATYTNQYEPVGIGSAPSGGSPEHINDNQAWKLTSAPIEYQITAGMVQNTPTNNEGAVVNYNVKSDYADSSNNTDAAISYENFDSTQETGTNGYNMGNLIHKIIQYFSGKVSRITLNNSVNLGSSGGTVQQKITSVGETGSGSGKGINGTLINGGPSLTLATDASLGTASLTLSQNENVTSANYTIPNSASTAEITISTITNVLPYGFIRIEQSGEEMFYHSITDNGDTTYTLNIRSTGRALNNSITLPADSALSGNITVEFIIGPGSHIITLPYRSVTGNLNPNVRDTITQSFNFVTFDPTTGLDTTLVGSAEGKVFGVIEDGSTTISVTATGSYTSGSKDVSVSFTSGSISDLVIGSGVTSNAAGIATNSSIVKISGNTITLNNNATVDGSGNLTFNMPYKFLISLNEIDGYSFSAACNDITVIPKPNGINQIVTTQGEGSWSNGTIFLERIIVGTPPTTTLSADLGNESTTPTGASSTITINTSANLNPNGGVITIGNEQIAYDTYSSGTIRGIIRGINGTNPSAHLSGETVTYYSNTYDYANTGDSISDLNRPAYGSNPIIPKQSLSSLEITCFQHTGAGTVTDIPASGKVTVTISNLAASGTDLAPEFASIGITQSDSTSAWSGSVLSGGLTSSTLEELYDSNDTISNVTLSDNTTTCSLTSGSNTNNLRYGMVVEGTGIPFGTYIRQITNSTQFVLSNTPTVSAEGATLTLKGYEYISSAVTNSNILEKSFDWYMGISLNIPESEEPEKYIFKVMSVTDNCLGPYTSIPKILPRFDIESQNYQQNKMLQPICEINEGDVVETDQGAMKVSKVMKSLILGNHHYVKFEKDCLGYDLPSDDVYFSEDHPISLGYFRVEDINNGISDPTQDEEVYVFIESKYLVDKIPGISLYKIQDYTYQYNLVFDKQVTVNTHNLDCLTHHPIQNQRWPHNPRLIENEFHDKSVSRKESKPFLLTFDKLMKYKPENMELKEFLAKCLTYDKSNKFKFDKISPNDNRFRNYFNYNTV